MKAGGGGCKSDEATVTSEDKAAWLKHGRLEMLETDAEEKRGDEDVR